MQSQETKQKTERRAVQTNRKDNNMTAEKRKPEKGVSMFSYCDHCGFAIYDASDAYIVKGSEDRIHRDCFSEYIEEHRSLPMRLSLPRWKPSRVILVRKG